MWHMSGVLRQLLLAAMVSACAVSCGKQDEPAQAPSNLADTSKQSPSGPYGAVAVSADGLHAGFADGHASRALAEASAVATCAKSAKDSAGRCESRLWFKDGCGALSTGDDGAFGTGWGADPRRACEWALQTCRDYRGRNCRADFYVCSPRKLSGTCDGSFKSYQ